MTIMKRHILSIALAVLAIARPLGAMTPEERRQYLQRLLETLPDVPSFKQWLEKTGELPPDFDSFPRSNPLPEPLKFLDGKPVRNAQEWRSRRAEIRQLFEKYDLGTFPPKPKIDHAVVLDETPGHGYLIGAPHKEIRRLIAHRLAREQKVISSLKRLGNASLEDLLPHAYDDVPVRMHRWAARSLTAHLDKLVAEHAVAADDGRFTLVQSSA